MPKERQISNNEWLILEYLWLASPRTLMQIVKEFKESKGWSKSTIVTMITRMEQKGLIHFESGGKARLYYPSIVREEAAMEETKSLLGRVYQGSLGMLVNTLVQQQELNDTEIQELYQILQDAEEKRPCSKPSSPRQS